ncbi:MAG: PrsW family intramembrane metalloprotease [Enterococcus lacertideformus]|uniref:PrsW family intramembrane metalloprotease n=1 Tax=Enterococcus lacertideformus TaxID=2771493 RepID=A0A931AU71_9ENTE|nr:PrsW family intramembrane metalloprotease [Enterococcus lacertideformus]
MKKVILFLLLFLMAIGIDYEINSIGKLDASNGNKVLVLIAILLLLLYILPALFLFFHYEKYFSVPLYLLGIGLFFGSFVPGWLAAYENEFAKNLMNMLVCGNSDANEWLTALTASIVEETVKASCALALIYLFNKRRLSEVFFIGACVGLGFQILEDMSYIVNQANESMQELFPQTMLRISGAISSHWAYTGLFVLGLFCLLTKSNKCSLQKKYVWLFSPLVLHFLWNSPLNQWMLGDISLVSALLTAVTLMLVFQTIGYFYQIEKEYPFSKNVS